MNCLTDNKLNSNVGLDNFVLSSTELSKPLLGNSNRNKRISLEEINKVYELSTETELLSKTLSE